MVCGPYHTSPLIAASPHLHHIVNVLVFKMQLMNRVAVNGGVRHSVRHVCGPAGLKQQAARTMPVRYVASADNAAAKMTEDDSFDKEEAYRRFEELLGDADVSFEQGDKVRRTMTSGGAASSLCCHFFRNVGTNVQLRISYGCRSLELYSEWTQRESMWTLEGRPPPFAPPRNSRWHP